MLLGDSFPGQKEKWSLFGRFDYWDVDNGENRKFGVYGVAYRLNQYIRLIVNGITSDHRDDTKSYSKVMFTTDIVW